MVSCAVVKMGVFSFLPVYPCPDYIGQCLLDGIDEQSRYIRVAAVYVLDGEPSPFRTVKKPK